MAVGLWVSGIARAQTPAAYAGTPTAERIAAWLKSTEGRDRAWGAYYAAQTKDTTFLPELEGLAEQWEALPPHHDPEFPDYKPDPTLTTEQVDRQDAMTAVLDAVILLDGRVSSKGLLKLQGDFPAQTAVLLSRMPEAEVEPTLLTMYHDAIPQHGEQRRVAAELLAREKTPPAGFVASLMRGADVEGDVTVQVPAPSGPGTTSGFGVACDADVALEHPQPSDWPQVGQYSLRTYIIPKNATSYPIAGRIQVARIEGARTKEYPHCWHIGDLDTQARLQIVAELLGCSRLDNQALAKKMGRPNSIAEYEQNLAEMILGGNSLEIQSFEKAMILATSTAEYEQKLREFVAQEEQNILSVETQLQAKGLVSADEIARGEVKPRLHLTVIDMRAYEDRKFKLPSIDFHDPRIDWGVPMMRYWPY